MELNVRKFCPFCGGNKLKLDSKARKVGLQEMYDGYKAKYTCSVRCNICHARGPTCTILLKTKTFTTIDEQYLSNLAFEAWNNRAV